LLGLNAKPVSAPSAATAALDTKQATGVGGPATWAAAEQLTATELTRSAAGVDRRERGLAV